MEKKLWESVQRYLNYSKVWWFCEAVFTTTCKYLKWFNRFNIFAQKAGQGLKIGEFVNGVWWLSLRKTWLDGMPKWLGCHVQPWQPVRVLLIAVVTEWVTNNGSLFTWQTTKSGSLCVCGEVNNKHSHFLLVISALISLPLCCFISRPSIFIGSSTKGLGDTLFKLWWPRDPPITQLGMSSNWWHGSHRRLWLDDGGVALMTELNFPY